MRRLSVCLLAALAFASCIPPEPDDDLIVKYDPEETVMGEIQQRGELVVAVPPAEPFKSFTSSLGTVVGDALGVDTEIVPMEPPEILTAPGEGSADLAFPLITVTEKLVRRAGDRYALMDPFYVAHQRLLVRTDSPIEQVEDLDGVVCQYADEATGANVAQLNPQARPISPPDPRACSIDVARGKVQALSAADWLAFPLLVKSARALELVGEDLTTEAYAPVVESGASAWVAFVEGVLAEADAEGDWLRFYAHSFTPHGGEETAYPEMTIEEAAALFPVEV
ncbi:MAG TPA: transporter substrate-binding domain-containing protein [Actinomycetota bacterium]|nr:transporter substrate-binding domain-containing protein [Actinomycetota bacterium]